MMRPMRDHVVIAKNDEGDYSGLLIIPGKSNQSRGTILAVSKHEDMFSAGDDIMFAKNSGMMMEYEGIEYIILKTIDIMAKIKKD
jgi:co-chaperonin GroES (HSP10)